MGPRSGLIALLGATALFGAQLAYYYPQLPDTVASHFDAAGNANGTSSKQSFLITALVIAGVDCLLFLGIGWMLKKLPVRLINMPHRDYWLAPERREQSIQGMVEKLLWFGAVTQLFLVGVFQLSIRANLGPEARLPGVLFWGMLVVYLVYTGVWLVGMYRRFPKPPVA